jgi:hypothetical protein
MSIIYNKKLLLKMPHHHLFGKNKPNKLFFLYEKIIYLTLSLSLHSTSWGGESQRNGEF